MFRFIEKVNLDWKQLRDYLKYVFLAKFKKRNRDIIQKSSVVDTVRQMAREKCLYFCVTRFASYNCSYKSSLLYWIVTWSLSAKLMTSIPYVKKVPSKNRSNKNIWPETENNYRNSNQDETFTKWFNDKFIRWLK